MRHDALSRDERGPRSKAPLSVQPSARGGDREIALTRDRAAVDIDPCQLQGLLLVHDQRCGTPVGEEQHIGITGVRGVTRRVLRRPRQNISIPSWGVPEPKEV